MSSQVYATLEELQQHIDASSGAAWEAADLANMQTALEAASRWIDAYCGTRFYTTAETRRYTADWYDLVYIHDVTAVSEVATDENDDGICETVWSASDYVLEPYNATLDERPFRQIRISRGGRYSFPRPREAVQVTGSFGSSAAAPANVRQACLLVAHRLWRRRDAIFGVAGTPGLGVTVVQARISADSDVMQLLEAVDRRRV
jgi:hypothetical protein